ncbi:MAG: ABC transporter substrate-binding protein [Chloroflexi bacterium]|nr:ABC transporter substrate-binding protein [Chloroflexota bacterium]
MKRTIVILLVLALAVIAAACSPASAPAPTAAPPTAAPQATTAAPTTAPTSAPAAKTVELQFWHGQSQTQEKALNALIAKFNASHPGIKVTGTFQGGYSDLYKKVTAAIAAGSPPDLAIGYQNDIANYINSDAVVPLDDYMKDPKIGFTADDLKDISPSFIDKYPQFGNKVYSLAFMRSMEVMFYNADMLKAAGFDKPPATWDDFMKACAAASKPPDVVCYEMPGSGAASTFSYMVWTRGGELMSADGKSFTFDQKAGLDAMTMLSDLFTKKYAILQAKSYQDQTDFSLGKVLFTFGSTAGLPYYTSAIKDAGNKVKNWGIAVPPHNTPNPIVDVYGPSVAVFKTNADKQQAAFVFIKWLMDNDPSAEWVKASAYFPPRASTKTALADYIKANPLYGEALGWVQYGRVEPTFYAAWNPTRNFIGDAMVAVANGKATPEQALKDAVQKANAALAGK